MQIARFHKSSFPAYPATKNAASLSRASQRAQPLPVSPRPLQKTPSTISLSPLAPPRGEGSGGEGKHREPAPLATHNTPFERPVNIGGVRFQSYLDALRRRRPPRLPLQLRPLRAIRRSSRVKTPRRQSQHPPGVQIPRGKPRQPDQQRSRRHPATTKRRANSSSPGRLRK
jgi:hypothetical protein